MTSEFGKMLKCLTTRTYRSLQEDNYTPVPVGTKPSPKEEEKPTSRRKSHSEPPSTLGSPQKNGVGPVVGGGGGGGNGGGGGGGGSGCGGAGGVGGGGSGGGGGGGGFHSFRSALGLRLKNAATRCLEKKSEADQQGAAGCHACRDATGVHRYSRFPANTSNACCCCGRNRSSTGQSLPTRPLPSGDGSPHVHPTALTRTFAHPHRGLLVHPLSSPSSSTPKSSGKSSGGLSVPKCLRRYRVGGRSEAAKRLRERSKSDNSLQRFSVNPTGKPDHLLQRLFKNGSEDQIFLPVVTGRGTAAALGFGDIGDGSVEPSEAEIAASKKRFARRSRSLERASNFRVYPVGDVSAALCNSAASRTAAGSSSGDAGSGGGWRSLERNHKFRIRAGGCGAEEEEVLRRAAAALPARAPSLPHHAFPHCDACPLAVTNGDPHHLVAAASAAACAGGVLVCRVGGGGRWEGATMPRYLDSVNASGGGIPGGGAGGGGGGGFLNKPARGWLHSDRTIAKEGVCYAVRYIGCLEVNTSMKILDFDTRSQIAKECINRVCEEAGLKTADKKRKVDRKIQRIIGDKPIMDNAGSNVNLLITSTCLKLTLLDSGKVIADHEMPTISFASGGDPDTLDFIAYVAKDAKHGRACFVLECGGGLAQDVITTVGQAFELRFKEYLKRTPKVMCISGKSDSLGNAIGGDSSTLPMSMVSRAAGGTSPGGVTSWEASSYDPEYYNDLPGKVPPDIGPPPVPPLPHYHGSGGAGPSVRVTETPTQPPAPPPLPTEARLTTGDGQGTRGGQEISGSTNNLIDFHCEVEGMAPPAPPPEHDYENDLVVGWGWTPATGPSRPGRAESGNPVRDVFDMQPFGTSLTLATHGAIGTIGRNTAPLNPASQKAQLHGEAWFHGPISRKEAETLLLKDGDFLVRESQGSPGQYVLTGMQSGIKKHLLLVDPEGVVRTKDRMFESVSHLINYHCENELPIISAESALVLRHPVHRPR